MIENMESKIGKIRDGRACYLSESKGINFLSRLQAQYWTNKINFYVIKKYNVVSIIRFNY